MDIAEFLLARIAEDEAVDPQYGYLLNIEFHAVGCLELTAVERSDADCDCGFATRWLAECEARRRIVELHKPWSGRYECPTCADGAGMDHGEAVVDRLRAPCPTMRLLALPYADHSDYDPAWSPLAVV